MKFYNVEYGSKYLKPTLEMLWCEDCVYKFEADWHYFYAEEERHLTASDDCYHCGVTYLESFDWIDTLQSLEA